MMIIQAEWRAPREAIQKEGKEYIGYVKNALSKKMAEGVMDILSREPSVAIIKQDLKSSDDYWRDEVCYRASLEWKPFVKCKDCRHRLAANGICPFRNYPPDDFFCANGEKED